MSATSGTLTVPTVVQDHDRADLGSTGLEALQGALAMVGGLLADLGSADPSWQLVGPMTARAAALARRAVGRDASLDTAAEVAPVVHQRDVAVAARALLREDVVVVDTSAALGVLLLSARISMALA